MENLNRLEFSAFLNDLLGVSVGGLVDLQQPGGLRQRPQGVYSVGALEVPVLQPFLQVTDVAPKQTRQLQTHLLKLKANSTFIKMETDLICIPFLQEHISLRSMMLFRVMAPTR